MEQTLNTTANATAAPAPLRHRLRYSLDSRGILGLLLLGTIALVVLLAVFIVVQFSTRVDPLHFALTDQMQMFESLPLEEPGISKASLLNWVNEALAEAFSYNYSNVDKQAAKLSPYFSENAMKLYLDMIINSEDFAAVKEKKYVVAIRATATPEILTSKAFKGRYAWQIRVPALITFSNAASRGDQEVNLEFLVWRVTDLESPNGVLVASFSRTVISRSGQQAIDQF